MKYVAFLRGINVGGHRKFPKVDQLKLLEVCKFNTPNVYLHTGNWVFDTSEKKDTIESKISEEMMKTLGWKVPVLLKTAKELESILNNCPFEVEKKEKSYFILPFEEPTLELINKTNLISYPNEEFVISKKCIYLYVNKGMGQSKCSNNWFENKLKITATARNYNTMLAILKLLNS